MVCFRERKKVLQSGQCVGGDRTCKEDVSGAGHRVLYGELNGSGSVLIFLYFLCVAVFLATRENQKFDNVVVTNFLLKVSEYQFRVQ